MIFDYNKTEEKAIPNFKGGDGEYNVRMCVEGSSKLMKGRLVPGSSIGLHTHTDDAEAIFVLSGSGKAICDGNEERVFASVCHFCPKGHSHTLINDGKEDLIFYAAVIG